MPTLGRTIGLLSLLLILLPLSMHDRSKCLSSLMAGGHGPVSVPAPPSGTVSSERAAKHIVVAHCKENLAWLDQLRVYDPEVCRRVHIHVYSKCGTDLDLETAIPGVAACATLHRLLNFGTQEYAYFRYVEDLYDNLPPIVAFVQGGGLTENPHLIYDLASPDPPGLTYQSLTRHVRTSWHFFDYDKVEKKGEAEIVASYFAYLKGQEHWISDWRSMFTASRAQIRRNPWIAYVFINEKLARGECKFVNCMTENLFSSFFGCNPLLFDDESPTCTSGVYTNLSNVVNEEDLMSDGLKNYRKDPARDTEWRICGNRTIFYAMSGLNGLLICLDGGSNGTGSAAANRRLLEGMINGDTWRADLSNQTFGLRPEWVEHEQHLAAQKQQP